MATDPKAPDTSGSREFEDDQQNVEEYFEQSGVPVRPISELLSQVDKLNAFKVSDEELKRQENDDDFDDVKLLHELERGESSKTPVQQLPQHLPTREITKISDDDEKNQDDYAESFASQQETAQLREDFDTITEKFNTLESQFNLVMKERQNLPEVIDKIRSDLNTQLTMFSDKLYTVLESQASKKDIQTALATIEDVRSEHSDQLKAASGYLIADPKSSSPIVNKGVSLKGKGKFKPVK